MNFAATLLTTFCLATMAIPVAADGPPQKNAPARILRAADFHQTLDKHRGQVVVVHFWATWCAPCLGELPLLAELAEKYRKEGVVFLAFSLDDPTPRQAERVAKVLRAKVRDGGFSPILSLSPSPAFLGRYFPEWEGDIPAFFVLDPSQRLQGSHIGDISPGEFQALVLAGQAQRKSGSP